MNRAREPCTRGGVNSPSAVIYTSGSLDPTSFTSVTDPEALGDSSNQFLVNSGELDITPVRRGRTNHYEGATNH